MGIYYYMAKMKVLVSFTYRFEVFAAIGTNLIFMLSSIFLWKAVYRGIDTAAGVNESQMLSYAVVAVMLASFYSVNVEFTLHERIRQGSIAINFFRPVNLLLGYLAEDVGQSVGSLANKLLPLALITVVFIQVPAPAGIAAGLLFILAAVFGFLILWTISALIGTLCFWYVDLGDIGTIRDGIILLLSGKLIPLWLFPEGMQKIICFLPFQYIYQTPLGIYIGQLRGEQIAYSLLIQLFWIVILTALLCFSWGKAQKCVLIQGG